MTTLTKTQISDLVSRMRAWGCSIDDITVEVRFRIGCSMLAAYRLANGMSQPRVVEKYIHLTGATLDQPILSRLEQFPSVGGRAPTAAQLIGLARVYGTQPSKLLNVDGVDKLAQHDRSIIMQQRGLSFPSASSARGPKTVTVNDDIDSEGAVNSDGLETTISMAGRRALRFSTNVSGSNVGGDTIDDLTDEVHRLALAYQITPIHLVLGDLVLVQEAVFDLLEGRQRPSETRRLYILAAKASGLLANACHDIKKNDTAMQHTRAAYVCADNAEDDGLRAWVRGLQSMISYWSSRPYEALKYVNSGSAAASQWSGSSAVWLASLRARAWGQLGNYEAARDAVDDAMVARDRVRDNELDELGGKFTFPLPRQLYYAADAFAWLDEGLLEANRLADESLRAYASLSSEKRSFVDESVARTDISLSYVRTGDLDGAAAALRPVLELLPAERVGGVVVNTKRIAAALADRRLVGSPLAKDLREELELFNAATAAKLLV